MTTPRTRVGWPARLALLSLIVAGFATSGWADAKATPWPAPVPNFTPPQPGEHPRLFFRKTDIPKLRERAQTPEGRAILKRLRQQLNGSDGESVGSPEMWTMSHVAGFGFLHVVTGDTKYADLGKEAMEQSFAGAKRKEDIRRRRPAATLSASSS